MDEKKRKINESHYKRPNHFDILVSMWNQGDFCDVTIQVDDQIYPAHKIILIAYIPYFRTMFSHDFSERDKDTISMSGVNPQSMKTIIQFAYTGKLSWGDVDDLPSLIKDADYLGLEDVKNEGIKILQNNFNYNKAIEVYHLSTMVCSSSLKERSQKIILNNLQTLSRSDEFLRLDFNAIRDMLSEEYSKLYTHEVFKGVLRWVEHDIADRYSNLMELCSLIQIGNADVNDILEIVNDVYHWSKLRQKTSFKSEIESYYQKSKDSIESGVNLRKYLSGIIICNEKNPKEFMMYNPVLGEWKKIRGTRESRWNFRIAVSNFHLFIIGGIKESGERGCKMSRSKGEFQFSKCTTVENESLNLKNGFNVWKRISPLGTPRRWFGIINVFKYIFVCGGINEDGALNSVEKYTVETDTWTYVCPMKCERYCFGVVAIDNYLYAVGGINKSSKMVREIERYDLTTNCWETLGSRLNTARRDFGIAVLNKKIYVCGGINYSEEDLDSVEVYDPSTNKWRYVASMPEARNSSFVVPHAGKLCVMGGVNDDDGDLSTAIEYDPETKKWSDVLKEMVTGMESIKGSIVGCTV